MTPGRLGDGEPSPRLARALIRSLSRGTTIPGGARYTHVGHAKWLDAQQELLTELAEDGHSETKFVRGAYGAGKSHFLAVMQDQARAAGWAARIRFRGSLPIRRCSNRSAASAATVR